MQQGAPYQQGKQTQPQQQYQGGQQQPQQQFQGPKQPISRGLVQIPVGTYMSKTKSNQDGSAVQETNFVPIGKFTEWEKHLNVDIFVNGEHLELTLFKNNPNNKG